MELGQAVFGVVQSWAKCEVERWSSIQGLLNDLIDFLAEKGKMPYEDDEFYLQEYWWGDCTCGLSDLLDNTVYLVEHDESCPKTLARRDWEAALMKPGKSSSQYYDRYKSAKCTCGFIDRYKEKLEELKSRWGEDLRHKDDCMLERPNFWHKPTGLKLMWYKYPLRSAYSNRKVDQRELLNLVVRLAVKAGMIEL